MRSATLKRLLGKVVPAPSQAGQLSWQCNICGADNRCPVASLERESAPCWACGATLRYRAVAAVLMLRLFGKVEALASLPDRRHLKGVGMSDANCYAKRLAARLGYTNTFYHREPRLDITKPAPQWLGVHDFVITSDVFEHVAPPVQTAFDNLYALLKPGGVVVFSVPFSLESETREHYPDLHRFSIRRESKAGWVLENVTVDGRREEFRELVFHGGPGSTLEMRLFSLAALQRHFAAAGFVDLRVHDEPYFEHGIFWWHPWSLVLSAVKPAA
jgi:SAM-dependent methyltransferase